LTLADLQRHVNRRAAVEYWGKKLSPATLKKEMASSVGAGPKALKSPNFAFLARHHQVLVLYAAQAERSLFEDLSVALAKLRQFARAWSLTARPEAPRSPFVTPSRRGGSASGITTQRGRAQSTVAVLIAASSPRLI
jgi:hypothetical protein